MIKEERISKAAKEVYQEWNEKAKEFEKKKFKEDIQKIFSE